MKGSGDGDTLWFDEWEGEAQLWMMGLAYVLHGQPSRPGLCQDSSRIGSDSSGPHVYMVYLAPLDPYGPQLDVQSNTRKTIS